MENRTLFDFDIDITQVLLAHYHSLPISGHITTYCHGRPFHGIICILNGSAQYHFVGHPPILLKQGDIAFIPASAAYEVYCIGDLPLTIILSTFWQKRTPSPIGCILPHELIQFSKDFYRSIPSVTDNLSD